MYFVLKHLNKNMVIVFRNFYTSLYNTLSIKTGGDSAAYMKFSS